MPVQIAGASTCALHQFSWQDFFYLTQQKGDQLEFETWRSSEELFVPAGMKPAPWEDTHPDVLPAGLKLPTGVQPGKLLRLRRIVNRDEIASKEMLQAGSSEPVVDQNGRWLFYYIQQNKPEYDYIAACELYKKGCYDTGGANINLPEQSIELKSSWRVMETCDLPDSPPNCKPEAQGSFHVARAVVEPYSPSHAGAVVVTVGLVGIHVVHKIPAHPEWIWATFEHRDLAPDCDDPTQKGASPYLLNNPECKGNFCGTNVFCNPCNGQCAERNTYDPSCTKPSIPTQVCRIHPIDAQVTALNASVQSSLPADSVWRNYQLVGTQDKVGGQVNGPDYGTILLSNLTMETYFQNGAKSMGPPPNNTGCFDCHNAGFVPSTHGGMQADFSHIFRKAQQTDGCGSGLPSFCPAPAPSPSGSGSPSH